MTFNSLEYAAFLLVVLGLYWTLKGRPRLWLLVVASYFFYGWWDYRFLVLLWTSTAVDYLVGRALENTSDEHQRKRRRLLAVSLATNLSILGFFKYAGFFTDSATDILEAFGLGADWFTLEVLLPVGISFYTFQTMSYSIDVYRRRRAACEDPVQFSAFVAFFPQLVAGPIERADQLLPQLPSRRRLPDPDRIAAGLLLIVSGLFRKVVLADLAAPAVSEAYGSEQVAGLAVLVGTLAFAIQIYGDFAGYTAIARGTSRLLGIELIHNFREPYLSRSVTEFWRRWHISLSTWLRDYLYIPLGGNRHGARRTFINLMVTMVLGGLWHGAALTFVVWGGLHGAYLAAERRWRHPAERTSEPWRPTRDLFPTVMTFGLVCFAWIFFRADSVGQALDLIWSVVTLQSGNLPARMAIIPVLAVATLAIDIATRRGVTASELVRRRPVGAGVAAGLAIGSIVVASGTPNIPFVYFQF